MFRAIDLAARVLFETAPAATEPSPFVIVLAGASTRASHEQVMAWLGPLVAALPAPSGTVISGGTAQGVSALAAAVAAAAPGWSSVGYVPATLPPGIVVDARYDRLRRTDADDFGLTEPLAYWTDLHADGVTASDVHVLRPLMMYRSPSSTARVLRFARSEPAPGSE